MRPVFVLLLLQTGVHGTSVVESWSFPPRRFRPLPDQPRPTVNFLQSLSLDPEECGTSVEVYSGESYLLRTLERECDWTLQVQRNVNLDLMCQYLHAPCSGSSYVDFIFTVNGRSQTKRFCDEKLYRNGVLHFRGLTSGYDLNIEPHNAFMKCVAVGLGGETRPGADDGDDAENPDDDGNDVDDGNGEEENCGRAATTSSRIIGGGIAEPDEYPWTVALRLGGYFCGGSLIARRWVLTAAHCTSGANPSQITAYLGCERLFNRCEQQLEVDKVIVHSGWQSSGDDISNDISLLRLKSPASLSPSVNTICLPSASTSEYGAVLEVAGWGQTHDQIPSISYVLKKAEVKTRPDSSCSYHYPHEEFICVNPGDGSTCNGDSGSFVGSRRNNRYEQDGIVSFGGTVCSLHPMGLTEVYNYKQWIKDEMAGSA